jgi:hypothetical protein
VWDSIKLYKKYNLSFFFLNEVIYFFLNEDTYYYNIFLLDLKLFKKGLLGLNSIKTVNSNSIGLKYFYLGKILILQNQGWVIILINYFISKKRTLLRRYDNSVFYRNFLKRFYRNIYNTNIHNNKYFF